MDEILRRKDLIYSYGCVYNCTMKLGLGIDTGGTFSDAVIYDFENKKVLQDIKTPTTMKDLRVCINNILNTVNKEYIPHIKLVSISTTLVTNACVEGKGSKAKLILIGSSIKEVNSYGKEYGMPSYENIIFVDGKVNLNGEIEKEPDWDEFKKTILKCKDEVEGFAIVQLFGSINPVFEVKAKSIVKELTNDVVVCGSELTSKLNYMRRAVSGYVNVKLIPIFNDFLSSIKENLIKHNIKAPISIVRCDGSMMSEEYARLKPIETILSGPAASIMGGKKLLKDLDSIIIDIGGTTTDLGIIDNNSIVINDQGATVGKNKTATNSVDILTKGIGGDSEIAFIKNEISIGPRRVEPISHLAMKYPDILKKFDYLNEESKNHIKNIGVFYYVLKEDDTNPILEYLKDYPKDALDIVKKFDLSLYNKDLDNLVESGHIMKCALTPTDVSHFLNEVDIWNKEGANKAVSLFARQYFVDEDDIAKKIKDKVCEEIYKTIIEKLYSNKISDEVISFAYNNNNTNKFIDINMQCKYPLVGLGAPANIYLPTVAKKLNTECIIPKYHHVANALGAIAGDISLKVEGELQSYYHNSKFLGYRTQAFDDTQVFEDYDEALKYITSHTQKKAKENLLSRGATNSTIETLIEDKSVRPSYKKEDEEISNDDYLIRLVKIHTIAKCSILESGIF